MSQLVFPSLPGLDIAMVREPLFDTKVLTTLSGRELRATWWSYPRYRYQLKFNAVRSSAAYLEFQKLVGFLARHLGRWDSFLFQDVEDNAVTTHNFDVGDAATTDFQLQRTLVATADLVAPASRAYWPAAGDGYEPVFELNGNPSIFKNAVLQTLGVNYTLPGQGIVHFLATPANGDLLTWTGSYYRRVRFEDDNLSMTRLVQSWWDARQVNLISVKPTEASVSTLQLLPWTETPSGTINGTTGSDGNATFTLARTPTAGYPVNGYRNGIRLVQGVDFTISGATITALTPNIPITGDSYVFDYFTVQ